MRRSVLVLLALITTMTVVVAVVGCSGAGKPDPELLVGKTWTAVEIAGVDEVGGSEGPVSTAQFQGSAVGGAGGVNSYSGTFVASPGGKMVITELISTLMAGPEPAMSQETAYMDALDKVASYEVSESELTLKGAAGERLIRFEVAE